jgi:beta-galactosidase
MIKSKNHIISLLILLIFQQVNASERIKFTDNWKFYLGDTLVASETNYDDSKWRILNLPHDWSIEGKFSEDNPATPGGGALPGGVGWYRKSFKLLPEDKNHLVFIDFDGIYRNAEVWINGHYLGIRPYGYSSFRYNLTPYLFWGDSTNVIAVRVDNSKQPNSRWYSGSGIYRNVWLVKSNKLFVEHWGTYITSSNITDKSATLNINVNVHNISGKNQTFELANILLNSEKTIVDKKKIQLSLANDTSKNFASTINITNPHLWSIEDPYLYTVRTVISINGRTVDEYDTRVGIRFFEFTTDQGFRLNGKPLKINGVCNHHDLGCLGAAINVRAIERQLEILKDMGVNAIRTSHNPPAPELLDLCDKMGFLVMDEAFDMWKKGKTPYDYSLDFDQWHKRDLEDMIKRDRNHPSIIIWSIGNEILEQWDSTGIEIAKELTHIVKSLDPTRPVTSACNDPRPQNYIIKSEALDLIGYNYHHNEFPDFIKVFPGKKFIATETVSALASRDCYNMPSDSIFHWPIQWDQPFTSGNPDYTCSSYDNCCAPWGSTHEQTLTVIKGISKNPLLI